MLDFEIDRNVKLLSWFDTPLGRKTLLEEGIHLSDPIRRFHGDTLLWSGPNAEMADLTRHCMVRSRVFAEFVGRSCPNGMAGIRTQLGALPIANASVEGVVLHHALDFAEDPRHVFREAVRILAPGGRLLVCGFNPYSLWGLRRIYAGLIDDAFTDATFVAGHRLNDWLAVLGFEREGDTRYIMHRPPLLPGPYDGPRWQKIRAHVSKWPLGGVYIVQATKSALSTKPLDRIKEKAVRQSPLYQQRISTKSSIEIQRP